MDPDVVRKVEAVLFASGRFLDATRVAELIDANPKHVTSALKSLRQTYADQGSALHIVEDEGAWKLHVRDEYLDLVSKIISDAEVSGPVLETLAVIAWRTPILQSEVVNIRGSNAYEHVKELVERGFVMKEPEGRSYELRITDKFFDYFDIEGRDDIRKVFKEVEEAHRQKEMEVELAQKRLEKAIKQAEDGESAVVDIDEPEGSVPAGEEATGEELTEKGPKVKRSIDDLDSVLEKSQKTRERIAEEMAQMRSPGPDEETSEEVEESEDMAGEESSGDEDLDEARRIREQVEKDADEISD